MAYRALLISQWPELAETWLRTIGVLTKVPPTFLPEH